MIVHVHLQEQSEPVVIENVRNAYTKGPLYCVMTHDRVVHKWPLTNIFRITEIPDVPDDAS